MFQQQPIDISKGPMQAHSKFMSSQNYDYTVTTQGINSLKNESPIKIAEQEFQKRKNQTKMPGSYDFHIKYQKDIETPQDSINSKTNTVLDTKGSTQTKYLSNIAANQLEQNRPFTSSHRQMVNIQSKKQMQSKEHLKNKSVSRSKNSHPRSAFSTKTMNVNYKKSSSSNFAETQIQTEGLKPHDLANQSRQTSSKNFLIQASTQKHVSGYLPIKDQASYQFGSQIFRDKRLPPRSSAAVKMPYHAGSTTQNSQFPQDVVKQNIRQSFTSSHISKVKQMINKSKASLNERYENVDEAGVPHSFFSPTDTGEMFLQKQLQERSKLGDEFRKAFDPNSKLSNYIQENQLDQNIDPISQKIVQSEQGWTSNDKVKQNQNHFKNKPKTSQSQTRSGSMQKGGGISNGKLNINERSRQILKEKIIETDLREKDVVTKYFKKGQEDVVVGNSKDPEFGMFIDYYIRQSEGQQYVTKQFSKFEEGLLEHVKKIRSGSVLLNQPKSQGPGAPTDGPFSHPHSEDKFVAILNDKIKSNFKIDSRSEREVKKLFTRICESRTQPKNEAPFTTKKDLSLFISFLKDSSDHKILANKTYTMICRLEKAITQSHKIHLNDFIKFICQPGALQYNDALNQFKTKNQLQSKPQKLNESDVNNLWTEEDEAQKNKLKESSLKDLQRMKDLQYKHSQLQEDTEKQLKQTLKTLEEKANQNNCQESIQALATYKRKIQDSKQKTLDVRNRKIIASRIFGVDNDYLDTAHQKETVDTIRQNPFINRKDLKNIKIMFKKLNDNLDKLEIFKKGVKSLPDIELVQQKLKQFGEALGFAQQGIESKESEGLKMLEGKKLEKFMNSKDPSVMEKEYIQAASDDIYRNLLELNQIIHRREIMVNINEQYVGLDKKNINTATWKEKISKNLAKKDKYKKTRYHKDFRQPGEVVPKSELDSDDLKEEDSATLSSDEPKPCSSQLQGSVEFYDSEIDNQEPEIQIKEEKKEEEELKAPQRDDRVKPMYLVRALNPVQPENLLLKKQSVIGAHHLRSHTQKEEDQKEINKKVPTLKRVSVIEMRQRNAKDSHAHHDCQDEDHSHSHEEEQKKQVDSISLISNFDTERARRDAVLVEKEKKDREEAKLMVEMQEKYLNEKRKVKFQDELSDCKGEIWLFRSQITGNAQRGFMKGFEVYSFKHSDVLEHGAKQFSLQNGIVSIVTKSDPLTKNEDNPIQLLKNRLYYIDRNKTVLNRSYGDFEAVNVGQVQIQTQPPKTDIEGTFKNKGSFSYIISNLTGKLRVIDNYSLKELQMPPSTLINRQFRYVGHLYKHYIALHSLDAQEVCIIGNLQKDEMPPQIQYPDTDSDGNGYQDHTDHLDEHGRHIKPHQKREPPLSLWKFDKIKFQVKISKLALGKHHILGLSSAKGQLYTWGNGESGQLGHGDYEDLKYPRLMKSITSGITDILAVGNSSLCIDGDLTTIQTWGCNLQGQLASQGTDVNRCMPGKISNSKDSLDVPIMLRGHYEDAESPNTQGEGRCTLSYMTDTGDIFVWGYFNIPANGCQQIERQIQNGSKYDSMMGSTISQPGIKKKSAMSVAKSQQKVSQFDVKEQEETDNGILNQEPGEEFIRRPVKLNFMFDKSLKMKIHNYQIDLNQIVLIASSNI